MKRLLILLTALGLACDKRDRETPTEPVGARAVRISAMGGQAIEEPARLDEIPVLLGDVNYDDSVSFWDMTAFLGYTNTGAFFIKPSDNVDTMVNFLYRFDCNCDGWTNIGDVYSLLAFFDSTRYGIDPWPGGLPGCLAPVTAARQQALLLRHHDLLRVEK